MTVRFRFGLTDVDEIGQKQEYFRTSAFDTVTVNELLIVVFWLAMNAKYAFPLTYCHATLDIFTL